MAAQTVKEVPVAQAKALIARGVPVGAVGSQVYAVKSMGVTMSVQPASRPGYVRLVMTKGCAC